MANSVVPPGEQHHNPTEGFSPGPQSHPRSEQAFLLGVNFKLPIPGREMEVEKKKDRNKKENNKK
jgi:hypothetical protein